MKLRTSLAMLLALTATMASAVDLYSVFELPDHGKGSRGRHIRSFDRNLATAVGDVIRDDGVRNAAIWPMITRSGPGQLIELTTEDPYAFSTAASYARLNDGRYLVVGQQRRSSGMLTAAAWINSSAMHLEYISLDLTAAPGSTGSEALDVVELANGGGLISGTDWFTDANGRPTWLAVIWIVSPTGQVTERMLPVPPGTGWATARSFGDSQNTVANAIRVVGQIQQTPDGPWRACRWQVNLLTGNAQFGYIDRNGDETYAYRMASLGDSDGTPATDLGDFAIGWTEVGGQDFGTMWRLHQGCTPMTLSTPSRLYGINTRGYVSGWFMRQGMLEGLVSHISRLGQGPIAFADLIISLDTWEHGFHLFCVSEHGFNTGCGTSSDYPGGADLMHAHAGVPTGTHSADQLVVQRGRGLDDLSDGSYLLQDGNDDEVEAKQGRVVLDASILSLPTDMTGLNVMVDVELEDQGLVEGDVSVFNWETKQWDKNTPLLLGDTGTHEVGWATFPNWLRSPSGEVRLRISIEASRRREIVRFDAIQVEPTFGP